MRCPKPLLLMTALGFTACTPSPQPATNTVETVRAQATVFSVSPENYQLILETPAGRRLAYWTQNTVFIRGNQTRTDYVLSPGTLIQYSGLENRNETWLRVVWILKD